MENKRLEEEEKNNEALKINSKWEYKVVHLKNLNQIDDLQIRLNDELLDQYGKLGWELVNVITPTVSHKLANHLLIASIALVFKRKLC